MARDITKAAAAGFRSPMNNVAYIHNVLVDTVISVEIVNDENNNASFLPA